MVNSTSSTDGYRSIARGRIVHLIAALIPTRLAALGATFTVALLTLTDNAGCSRRSDDPASSGDRTVHVPSEAGSWQGTPTDLLSSIFARYRRAETYHDRGQVRLSYQADGRYQSDLAPLRVWLDRGILDVAAYDLRIRQGRTVRGDDVMTAWIVDPAINHFDSQVMQKTTNKGRPNLESILSDLVLADRLQAGLAGPPPQLEWLLAEEPMKRLFDDQHRFEFAESESVEGHRCHVVRVDASGDRYQFWIDQKQGVIRRVDLPMISVPAGASELSTMKLTLELSGATFGSPQQSPPVASLPSRPRFVTRFLPLPPLEPSGILGTRPDAYRLTDLNAKVVLEANRVPDRIRVLGRFVGGEASLADVALLQNWNSRLPPEIANRIETIVFVDGSVVDQIPFELTLPLAIDNNETASRQFSLMSGGLTILDDEGRIVWLQPQVTPRSLVAAGTIIGDLIQGIDVPGRLREQWQQDVRAYQDAIDKVSIRNPVLIK